jgi:2-dehydro-3-deoxyphosphogluconate aldolase/(4S)-4-hydroxy-2-oxoglutarate aldolase
MDVARFRRLPLLGILRGITSADVPALADVAGAAGLEAIEVTMNTPDAPGLIRQMVAAARGRIAVGAGTVLGVGELEQALEAGATFVVMPVLIPEVAERCTDHGIPVFPGALTPQEVFHAWRAGATMVKVFPAASFGPGYLREIKGPFADVELLACGGVNADNMAEYFAAGASAVAFGASVFRSDWLGERRYERVGEEVRKLVAACRAAVA